MQKCTLMIVLVLLVAGAANANTVWNATSPDPNNWNIAANWASGLPGLGNETPPLDNKAVFNGTSTTECIVSDAQTVKDLVTADGSDAGILRIVDGGNLTTTGGWMSIGYNAAATLIVENGGQCNFNSHMWLGMQDGGDGLIEINGGIINGGKSFGCGEYFGPIADPRGQCKIYVNSGELNLHHWTGDIDSDRPVFWEESFIDIKFGKLTIANDSADAAQAYIDAGKITGFGGDVTPDVVFADGVTTITAVDPGQASPTMNETVVAGDITLQWINYRDPGTGLDPKVEVWFGTDPNKASGNFKSTMTGTNLTSADVTVSPGTYYWQVDYLDSELADANGVLYSFNVTNDLPPSITMLTKNTLAWAGEPVVITATITDDAVSQVTVVWSSSADPNVTFYPPTTTHATETTYPVVVSTTVTANAHISHTTITATVSDEQNPTADSSNVVIDFAANACQAARGGFLKLADVYTADVTGPDGEPDCIIDLLDLAELSSIWLLDYSLDDIYIINP